MATNVVFNGTTYSVPAVADVSWGNNVSSYLIAIAAGCLQKTGGAFTLTAEVDFGGSFGLKSLYFKGKTANPAASGALRLSNTELIAWRNAANSADLGLTVNSSNQLQFNGTPILPIALGAANTVLRVNSGGTATEFSLLANANIDAGAAIARTKIANGTAYRVVVNDASGTLAEAALTASRAVVSDANGLPTAATTTATEIGYVNGVTSAIQTQLDAKQLRSVLTAKGSIYAASASDTVVERSVGSDGQVLTADSGQASGLNWTSPLTNPMDSAGDLIKGGALGAATKLDLGTANQVLAVNSGATDIAWRSLVNDNIDAAAAIAGTKIAPNFGSQNVVTTGTDNEFGSGVTGSTSVSMLKASTSDTTPDANSIFLVEIGGTGSLFFNGAMTGLSAGESTTDTCLRVRRDTTSGRSINAAGTINASGADYAEYMRKADPSVEFLKGEVCGVDRNGLLTKSFAESLSFVVKSTNPSYVGGDSWWNRDESEYRRDGIFDRDGFSRDQETERKCVDRIAFCGQVPVIITGGYNPGDYVIAAEQNGGIIAVAIPSAEISFDQYKSKIGQVWRAIDRQTAFVCVGLK